MKPSNWLGLQLWFFHVVARALFGAGVNRDVCAHFPISLACRALEEVKEVAIEVAHRTALAMNITADVRAFPLNPDMWNARELWLFDVQMRRFMFHRARW